MGIYQAALINAINTNSQSGSTMTIAIIIAVVLAVFLLFVLATCICCFQARKRERKKFGQDIRCWAICCGPRMPQERAFNAGTRQLAMV